MASKPASIDERRLALLAKWEHSEPSSASPLQAPAPDLSELDGPGRTPTMVARRLRLLAGLISLVVSASLIIQLTVVPLLHPELAAELRERLAWELELGMGALIALSLALYFYLRGARPSLDALDAYAAGHLFLVAGLIATFEALLLPGRGTPWGVSWICVIVVLYALVVPTPVFRTVVFTSLATALSPLFVALADWSGAIDTAPYTYVSLGADALFGTIVASAGSWLVHRRREVARFEFGAYELEELLGRGGMGEVWRARHRRLLRPAAVKVVRPELLAKSPEELDRLLLRFEREALATANLESPHTVRLFDFGAASGGYFYYAMELLDGVDLWELVESDGPVSPARAVHFLRQACHSLTEAHELGLVHRDIKPANLMTCHVGSDYDFVKVCDFGLVKWHQVPASRRALNLTGEGMVPGTPAFLSPEAVTGDANVSPRSDVYSLGCVAYWLLTGKLLFEAATMLDMVVKHVQDEPQPPSRQTELRIPAELDRLVLRCLSKDPSDRPADAGELERLLGAITFAEPWTSERARAWWEAHRPSDGARSERMKSASLRPRSWRPHREWLAPEEE